MTGILRSLAHNIILPIMAEMYRILEYVPLYYTRDTLAVTYIVDGNRVIYLLMTLYHTASIDSRSYLHISTLLRSEVPSSLAEHESVRIVCFGNLLQLLLIRRTIARIDILIVSCVVHEQRVASVCKCQQHTPSQGEGSKDKAYEIYSTSPE